MSLMLETIVCRVLCVDVPLLWCKVGTSRWLSLVQHMRDEGF